MTMRSLPFQTSIESDMKGWFLSSRRSVWRLWLKEVIEGSVWRKLLGEGEELDMERERALYMCFLSCT